MSALHVSGGAPAWIAVLARAAEPYRTERVALACVAAVVWLAHQHPESTSDALSALPWLLGAVAGRSAGHALAGAIGQRGATTGRERADADQPTNPGRS